MDLRVIMEKKYWNNDIETINIHDLKKLQFKRLKNIIKYIYDNNKIYHNKLKESNFKPYDIKDLKDIEKLPFLTKQDLRDFYPFGLLCTQIDNIVEVHASSGTTGKPVVGPYSMRDLEIWGEVMARSLWANGIRKNDRVQNSYGYGLFTGAHGFEKGAEKIGAMLITISSGNTRRQVNVMKDFSSTVLACTPSYSMYIAEIAEGMGYDPLNDFNLKIGCFGAESWSEEMRLAIEKRWGITAHEHYGLTEIIGPGIVSECIEKKLHINADHFYCEVIDPKTNETVNPGEKGELVFTTLTKEALPMLRFRTKDLAVYDEISCNCGRTLPIQSRIIGRSDDMMKIKGVIVFPSQIEDALMRVNGISDNYQIIKTTKNNITSLSIEFEPTDDRFKIGNLDELEKLAEDEIFTILNLKVPVKAIKPRTIPRSTGKAKRVIQR